MALANELAFLVVHLGHQAGDLAGDRVGVDRSDGANGFEIHADISLLCRGDGNGYRASGAAAGRRALGFVAVAKHEKENNGKDQQQEDPHENPPPQGLRRTTCWW